MSQKYHAVSVKNISVQNIFNSMDYCEMMENLNLAEAWLGNIKAIGSYKSDQISKGQSFEIKGSNNKTIAEVITPLPEDIAVIMHNYISFQWESDKKAILIDRLADEIEKNATLICQLEALVRGILPKHTQYSLTILVEHLRYYSSYSNTRKQNSKGLALGILSDDVFLYAFGCVLGPALAIGHHIILQTEPMITIIAFLIMQLAKKVGFPKNVIKVIPGYIDFNSFIKHESISIISYFGNFYTDKFKNAEYLASTPLVAVSKDKSPMIVFNNADLDSACNSAIDAGWGCTGVPSSLNIVIVQEDIYDIFVTKLKNRLSKVRIGPVNDKLTDISYVITPQMEATLKEAKMLGMETLDKPIVIFGANILQNNLVENIDSPIVTVVSFRTTVEAVNLANNTKFGTGASIWTENIGLANEVARKLQFGNIWINSFGKFSPLLSICPYKESGIGYISGAEGIQEFCCEKRLPTSGSASTTFPLPPLGSIAVDGIYNSKDLLKVIAASKKGHDLWQKKDIYERFNILKKLANEIKCNKHTISGKIDDLLDLWINLTYKSLAEFTNTGQVSYYKDNEIKSVREPVGVVVIDDSDIHTSISCVIGSLVLGNSVIILNFKNPFISFYTEICRFAGILKFPSGILNVILTCENDIFENLMRHKELRTYICFNQFPQTVKLSNLVRVCKVSSNYSPNDLLLFVTKIKNIWSNIGDSIL